MAKTWRSGGDESQREISTSEDGVLFEYAPPVVLLAVPVDVILAQIRNLLF